MFGKLGKERLFEQMFEQIVKSNHNGILLPKFF
jgi:hypothetical protein